MLSAKEVARVYETKLSKTNNIVSSDDIQLQYILKYIPGDTNVRILDAGCGNGCYANYLFNIGYKNVHGMDLLNLKNKLNFNYVKASIQNMPYKYEAFDFIFSNSVIFYLPDPNDAIIEYRRILNKKGIVIITAHTKYSLFTLIRIIKRWMRRPSVQHLANVRFCYSAKEYSAMFAEQDFEIVHISGFRLSVLLYPFYRKVIKGFNKYLKLNIILPSEAVSSSQFISKIKSVFGYHSILVARKQ